MFVPKDVVCGAISCRVRTYYASDPLLIGEMASPRIGSERTDRVQRVAEYAKAGIPLHWITELNPDLKVTVLPLGEGAYELAAEVGARDLLSIVGDINIYHCKVKKIIDDRQVA